MDETTADAPAEQLMAPPSWRCIDFISDLHLQSSHPRTFEAFSRYLQSTPANALFILGDLFEAWVGDDMRHLPFESGCAQALAAAGQRLALHLMVGNRDFLLGQDMARHCHAQLLDDPTVLVAHGHRHLLTHGDAWCLDDVDYLAFRRQVRQASWQATFLAQPMPARLATARQLRDASEARKHLMAADDWADVDPVFAAQQMLKARATVLIHGHTHRPGTMDFGVPEGQRHVLSDWELDALPQRAEVLRLTEGGMARVALNTPSGLEDPTR